MELLTQLLSYSELSFSVLAKTKYLLKDYKGALFDLNRADRACPDNHITLRCDTGSNSRSEIWSSLVRNPYLYAKDATELSLFSLFRDGTMGHLRVHFNIV
jgi:hypothetical protein